MSQKAVFLDRDGVINVDHGYVYQAEQFEFVDGVFEACRIFKAQGYKLIVVTNQSGIGRGYYSEAQFAQLTNWMKEQFAAQNCPIDAVYFCPHHPEKALPEYLQQCDCRKPMPGMLLQGISEFSLQASDCVMIGDKSSDIKAAKAAGIGRAILVRSGKALTETGLQLADEVWDSLNCARSKF
jgi:D-glycero-D-manno-heptose 1,7-bisphosphate phosphatase